MEKKQIEVACPCCETRLVVDVLTQTVLRTSRPSEIDETGKTVVDEGRWDEASARVAKRSSRSQDKLDEALQSERDKSDRLDDLFDKARDKVRKREDRAAGDDTDA